MEKFFSMSVILVFNLGRNALSKDCAKLLVQTQTDLWYNVPGLVHRQIVVVV